MDESITDKTHVLQFQLFVCVHGRRMQRSYLRPRLLLHARLASMLPHAQWSCIQDTQHAKVHLEDFVADVLFFLHECHEGIKGLIR
jgi:hypothetical protein